MPVDGWSGLEPVALRESAERLMRVEARVKAQLMAVTRALDETGLAKASGASRPVRCWLGRSVVTAARLTG